MSLPSRCGFDALSAVTAFLHRFFDSRFRSPRFLFLIPDFVILAACYAIPLAASTSLFFCHVARLLVRTQRMFQRGFFLRLPQLAAS
jgi:hypothetical protein